MGIIVLSIMLVFGFCASGGSVKVKHYYEVCESGVVYLDAGKHGGMTVKYNADGTVATCSGGQ